MGSRRGLWLDSDRGRWRHLGLKGQSDASPESTQKEPLPNTSRPLTFLSVWKRKGALGFRRESTHPQRTARSKPALNVQANRLRLVEFVD